MHNRSLSRFPSILTILLLLAACSRPSVSPTVDNSVTDVSPTRPITEPTVVPATQDAGAAVATQTPPQPTELAESTLPPPPSPTASGSPDAAETTAPTREPDPTPTVTVAAATPTVSPAAPTATRPASDVVVTTEPRVDVWTYGTGVVGEQIEGPLRTTVAFLNALIVDSTGNSSLPYLVPSLHAEALAAPSDGAVLGITTGYVSYDLNWLGLSGPGSQVEAILSYESGAQSTHVLDLRRSGDDWQITAVRAR